LCMKIRQSKTIPIDLIHLERPKERYLCSSRGEEQNFEQDMEPKLRKLHSKVSVPIAETNGRRSGFCVSEICGVLSQRQCSHLPTKRVPTDRGE